MNDIELTDFKTEKKINKNANLYQFPITIAYNIPFWLLKLAITYPSLSLMLIGTLFPNTTIISTKIAFRIAKWFIVY